MTKIDPRKIKADWSRFERRPPWSVVSSRELAEVLNVHLQTISNYSVRGILPPPEKHPRLRQNSNFYRIASIKAWINGTDEDTEAWAWIKTWLPSGIQTLEQAQYVCQHGWEVLGIEKPF